MLGPSGLRNGGRSGFFEIIKEDIARTFGPAPCCGNFSKRWGKTGFKAYLLEWSSALRLSSLASPEAFKT
jgi:hypothetical protein